MKIITAAKPLPRSLVKPSERWLLELDIRPTAKSELWLKLVVMRNRTELRKFWRRAWAPVSGRPYGLCSSLTRTLYNDRTGRKAVEVDPRYFAMIGLSAKELCVELVAHECVHAAYAFARRQTRNMWDEAEEYDEELIAYPAGTLTGLAVKHLTRHKLL